MISVAVAHTLIVHTGSRGCVYLCSGGHGEVHGPRAAGVQTEPGEHRVLQAGRCLLHGSGAVGDHIQMHRHWR